MTSLSWIFNQQSSTHKHDLVQINAMGEFFFQILGKFAHGVKLSIKLFSCMLECPPDAINQPAVDDSLLAIKVDSNQIDG